MPTVPLPTRLIGLLVVPVAGFAVPVFVVDVFVVVVAGEVTLSVPHVRFKPATELAVFTLAL